MKFIYDTFKTALPTLLLLATFTIYGYLLLNGYDIGSKKAKKYAHIYFYLGIYGSVITVIIATFAEHYKLQHPEIEKENLSHTTIVEENIEIPQFKKEKNIIKEHNKQKFCTWAFNIWIVYTVLWFMELPYIYDGLYILLGVIAGVCWWRSKKTNEQKDLEISEDK